MLIQTGSPICLWIDLLWNILENHLLSFLRIQEWHTRKKHQLSFLRMQESHGLDREIPELRFATSGMTVQSTLTAESRPLKAI
jgi:hypothetical protein